MLIKMAKNIVEDSHFQNGDIVEMLSKMTWNVVTDIVVRII